MTLSTYEQNFADMLTGLGATAIAGEQSGGTGLDAVRFANGAVVPWRAPASAPGSSEAQLVARMVQIVAGGHGKISAIARDPDRSPEWKATESAKIAAATNAAFATVKAESEKLVADFAALDAKEAVPPALAPTDAAGAILDSEIRDHVRELSPGGQAELSQRFQDGQCGRVIEALLRDPFGLRKGVLADTVPAAYLDLQAKADPAAARLRSAARERVDFLADRTAQIATVLPALSPQQQQAAELARAMAGRL